MALQQGQLNRCGPIGDEKACDVVSMTRYVREHGLIVCVMGRLVCVRLGTRDEVDKM